MLPISKRQFAKAAVEINDVGGTTLSARTGRFPRSGWMVATRPEHQEQAPYPVTGQALEEYAGRHTGVLRRTGFLGGGKEEGQTVIEPSKRFRGTVKGMNRAAEAMETHDQEAIFNLRTKKLFWNRKRVQMTPEQSQANRISSMQAAQSEFKRRHPIRYRKEGIGTLFSQALSDES
jgi:hypothetical protein